jgi:iron complex outermembrane receptor protein
MKRRFVAGAAIALAAGHAPAQQVPQQPVRQEKITVTASPLGRGETELAQPATVLDEEALRRKRAASIGDTLGNELGVQSSSFGAGAGRPIIRGLDGPRIRVLENGLGTGDASTVSPDHAVTTESLRAEQIEILRGPASLLYGSGAIGGVVNVVSKIVPRQPAAGLGGDAEARLSSGNDERSLAADLNGGAGSLAWHLDGYRRRTDDYRIPGGTLENSDVDMRGAGAGASFVGGWGHAGAGVQRSDNDYGVPTGEGVRIRMRQDRFEMSADVNERWKLRANRSDYRHEEVEPGGEVGTVFTNRATEARGEWRYAGAVNATLGAQWQDQDLAAAGEEAILPRTRSRAGALFAVADKDFGAWTLDAGVRAERETRRPEGELPSRDFDLFTPAIGAVWRFAPGYRLAIAATQAQRAPSAEELYSNGAHHATATFDVGDPNLRREVSRNVDVTLRKVGGAWRWKLNVFANRFDDYVYAASEDSDGDGIADRVDEEGGLDPEGEFLVQRYSQAGARFRGVEAEIEYRPEGGAWGVRAFGDVTRAKLADGSNLPRIAPGRVGLEGDWREGPWSVNALVVHSLEQKRAAPLETPTPAYTRVDVEVAWRFGRGDAATVFLKGTNLLDEEIRLHTSYLKDVAPQMGRSFTLGVRAAF